MECATAVDGIGQTPRPPLLARGGGEDRPGLLQPGLEALRDAARSLDREGAFGLGLASQVANDLARVTSTPAAIQAITKLLATRPSAHGRLAERLLAAGFALDLMAVEPPDFATYPRIFTMDPAPPPIALAGGLLAAEGGTILFGDGGAGKSWVALLLALTLALGDEVRPGNELVPHLRANCGPGPVLYVDYERRPSATRRRVDLLADGIRRASPGLDLPTLSFHYHDPSSSLWREAADLKAAVKHFGIQFVVIDSAGFAANGYDSGVRSGNGEDMPIAYFAALADLGVPTLSLAHITKGEGESSKPFGSAFWHNAARMTWRAKKATTSTDAVHVVELSNHKANDYAIADNRYISIDRSAPGRVSLSMFDAPLLEAHGATVQVERYLKAHGSSCVEDIAQGTACNKKTVESALLKLMGSRSSPITRIKRGRAYYYDLAYQVAHSGVGAAATSIGALPGPWTAPQGMGAAS